MIRDRKTLEELKKLYGLDDILKVVEVLQLTEILRNAQFGSISPQLSIETYQKLVLGSGPIEIFTNQMIGDSILLGTTGGMHERTILVERQAMGEA